MEDIDDIRPEFTKNSKKNPFNVPDGYFESFAERLQEKINEPGIPAGRIAGRKILRPAFTYITAFCVLVVFGIFISHSFHDSRNAQLNSETRMANLVQYSLENVDEQSLIDALLKSETEPPAFEITKEEVVNYLKEQNIDPNGINDEL